MHHQAHTTMKLTSCALWIGFWLLCSCSITVPVEHNKSDSLSSSDSTPKPKAIDDKSDKTLPSPPAQTEQEKLFKLEQKLNSRLQDFDEMLLIEKDLLSEEKRTARSGSLSGGESGENGGENEFGDSGSGQSGSSDTAGVKQGGFSRKNQTNGDIRGNRRSKHHVDQATGQGKPSETTGGHDDDIVARQLREAAEKETDPGLRKKLWDEYKLYKHGND